MGDAESAVAAQRLGDSSGADQPGRPGPAAADFPGVVYRQESSTSPRCGQIEQPLLTDRRCREAMEAVPPARPPSGTFSASRQASSVVSRTRVVIRSPNSSGRVAVRARAERSAGRCARRSVERLAPEQLDVGLGGRHLFGRRGGAAEVEARMRGPLAYGRGDRSSRWTLKCSPSKVTCSSVHSRRTSCMNSFVRA